MQRDNLIDPRIGNERTGIILTRGQMEQSGKMIIYAQMMADNAQNIIGYGSSEKFGVLGNPLTPDQKRRAIEGLWGVGTFGLVFLEDIGATDDLSDWANYVFRMVHEVGLSEPTDLYAGSLNDARWYEGHFASLEGPASYRRGLFDVWENPETGKRIHILDREKNVPISSSEVRNLIEQRDPAWMAHVPAKLWRFYEWEYPPHLRVAITISDDPATWPGLEDHPVGTKGIRKSDRDALRASAGKDRPEVLILRADGKWRPRSPAEAGKSLGD